MPQGTRKLTKRQKGGQRGAKSGPKKIAKGTRNFKPKKQALAAAHNKNKKLTAAITRNIEKETAACLARNGGKLSLLRKVSASSAKDTGDEASAGAKAPKFNTRKQFRLTS